MVDNTLLSIALPTIGRDLGGGTTDLQWVTAAYSLTFGGLLLTAGSIADRFGRRRVLLIGLGIFGTLSLLVVLVTSTGELIALRAALGVAAAMMAPITNSLVFRLFDDKTLRMRAMTVMIVVGMSGFVLGPVLGGTVLAHVSWEWLLIVNAPIALIAGIGVWFGVSADRRDDLTNDALDIPGALLSISTIGLACWSLTSGVLHGWGSTITVMSILGAIVAGVAFIWHERRSAAPMLDLSLFSIGTVRGAAIAQIGTSVAMASVMFGLILHFQYAYGLEPDQGRSGELADHHHHDRGDPALGVARRPVRSPHRLPRRRGLPRRLAGRSVVGRRARVPCHRGLHGGHDHRTAHRHDDLCGRSRRGHAGQPHLDRHSPQRHRARSRHQLRNCCGRHPHRGVGHHSTADRYVEQQSR